MHGLIHKELPDRQSAACKFLLVLCWCGGLILGVFFAVWADDSAFLMMRSAAEAPVSISGLLVIFVLPFLLSALAVYFSQPRLLFALCFMKACVFGFCAFCIDTAFGSAGWLVCFLLMFSELCFLPVMLWLWLRHVAGNNRALVRDLAICAGAAILIGSFDFCVVSPFLAMLL